MAQSVISSTAIGVAYAEANASHSAELFRRATASSLPLGIRARENGQGGVLNYDSDLVVSPVASSYDISVAVGEAWVGGTQGSTQGCYYILNGAAQSFAITPPGSGSQVYIVCAVVEDAEYSGSNNAWYIQLIAETAGTYSVPTPPENSLALGTVLVHSGDTSSADYVFVQGLATAATSTTLTPPAGTPSGGSAISTANSTAYGAALTIGAPAGRMAQVSHSTTIGTGVTLVTNMTAQFLRGGMTFVGASNELVIPVAGIYQVSWCLDCATPSASETFVYAIVEQDGFAVLRSGAAQASTSFASYTGSNLVQCSAGDTFTLNGQTDTGTVATTNNALLYSSLSLVLVSF